MNNDEAKILPPLGFVGGTKELTLTPVVDTPKREYAEMYVPIEDGQRRVTVLGSAHSN